MGRQFQNRNNSNCPQLLDAILTHGSLTSCPLDGTIQLQSQTQSGNRVGPGAAEESPNSTEHDAG